MPRPARSLARRLAVGTAALGAVAATALAGAPAALAAPATLAEAAVSLTYSCAFPTSTSNVGVVIRATLPDTATAGEPVTLDGFSAQVSVPRSVYGTLVFLGATTIDGSGAASATVTDAAGAARTVASDALTVPSTPLPPAGDLVVTASGTLPAFTVDAGGTATVAVSDRFSARLTPRTSSGGTTLIGTFDVPCTLVAGQDPTLGTIQVEAPL